MNLHSVVHGLQLVVLFHAGIFQENLDGTWRFSESIGFAVDTDTSSRYNTIRFCPGRNCRGGCLLKIPASPQAGEGLALSISKGEFFPQAARRSE